MGYFDIFDFFYKQQFWSVNYKIVNISETAEFQKKSPYEKCLEFYEEYKNIKKKVLANLYFFSLRMVSGTGRILQINLYFTDFG